MTDQEKIQKLEQIIEEAYIAFKILPELNVCSDCNDRNKEMLVKFLAQVGNVVNLKKEIL